MPSRPRPRALPLAFVAGVSAVVAASILAVVAGPPPVPAAPAGSPSPIGAASPSIPAPLPPTPTPPASGPAPADAFGVGSRAPALELRTVGGGTISLAALAGRPVWIVFTATWCPSCREDAALMRSLALRYRSTGLVVAAVHVREDEASVAAFAGTLDPAYPLALDLDGAAARDWRVVALPSHRFVDATGTIRAGVVGSPGPVILAEALGEILPGIEVTP